MEPIIKVIRKANKPGRPAIYFMIGLPGAGKSGVARKLMNDNPTRDIVRVNKDSARKMLLGEDREWSFELEKVASTLSFAAGEKSLAEGFDVIIDDTGLSTYSRNHWERIAKKYDYNLAWYFVDTPVSTCIKRCDYMGSKIPASTIVGMNNRNKELFQELRQYNE